MPKFFVPKENIHGNTIVINSGDVSHITRVLRMGIGDTLLLCDGKGFDYNAEIIETNSKEVICRITEARKSSTEPNIEVILFQGLPKASKMEYIIQKTTELGISRIVPCKLSRCVVKLENSKAELKKTERWQKIAESAAKQSGRGIVPDIAPVASIDAAIAQLKECDIAFAPYECEEMQSLKAVLTSVEKPSKIGFIIGPEGGFDISEIEKLRAAGIKTVTLGKRILRTETAGEAVLAMTMYEKGDINA
ncbi:MAG: 16S rRNA (uracil(1498)-N(3))-methyltransferase [bacterium]|nr:16S rRNA (uracil(1498)-N(3))-methyltransferase [bacterium]